MKKSVETDEIGSKENDLNENSNRKLSDANEKATPKRKKHKKKKATFISK